MHVPLDDVQARLRQEGYYVAQLPAGGGDAVQLLVEVARSLGELFVPVDCDPEAPVIRTAPARRRRAAPFDRPEQIGWHGDFSSYEDRPELSLVYITRPDPRGGDYGAWRLASVARVIAELRSTDEGRAAFELLCGEPLPFSYTDEGEPSWFRIIEPGLNGNFGLRFYLPSIRRGCIGQYGEVPAHVDAALIALERAADKLGEVVPTHEGSLLIASNWLALHDRVQQTVSRTQPNREALLCFVGHPYIGAFREAEAERT
jgi:hypothetical protein